MKSVSEDEEEEGEEEGEKIPRQLYMEVDLLSLAIGLTDPRLTDPKMAWRGGE